jgi:hypothetical protein
VSPASRSGRLWPDEIVSGNYWVGSQAGDVLDVVAKKKIPKPHWELNPRN